MVYQDDIAGMPGIQICRSPLYHSPQEWLKRIFINRILSSGIRTGVFYSALFSCFVFRILGFQTILLESSH